MNNIKKVNLVQSTQLESPKKLHILKFIVISLIGAILFMAPIPTEEAFNIPLGFAINWLEHTLFSIGEENIATWILLGVVTISWIGSALSAIFKPTFKNKVLESVFSTTPLYFVSRTVSAFFVWVIYLGVGPAVIISPFTGGVMKGIASHLIAVFLILGFAIPILTDFGIMEFMGILISKVVRILFTLPGRSSVDLMASWFGSSLASIILTRGQYEKGYYTGREAAVICTNFAFVSLPFSFVVANAIGIESHFVPWYLIICATCILLALITPRIWPLRGLSDTYLPGVGQQLDEVVPENAGVFKHAVSLAAHRASERKFKDVFQNGIDMYINIFFDLIPLILAWGTIALAIFEFTLIFQVISMPMGWFLQLFGIDGAMQFAPATLIGFLDMYLPALLLYEAYDYLATQLILGALSIVQIIYMTETGISILKSKIPLNIGKLFALFIIRTLIGIPVLTFLVRIFM
ncbi:MAG: hypothetical protein FWF59_09745 [Turicibacter sp.]|nr:hypothetical protein [Turicibacter sp.]